MNCLLVLLLGLVSPAPAKLEVAALRLAVTDLEASCRFYQQHVGFAVIARRQDLIVMDNHGVPLLLTPAEAPVAIEAAQCHVRFNFKTADLDATVAVMKRGGVEFVGEGRSAVGRYATFVDPSGHRHNMKQLFRDDETITSPRVYDVGIAVSDIERGLDFYGGVLGFEVMTRSYYPPVIPFNQRGATFFILADGASDPAPYEDGAWAGLAFASEDLDATLRELRTRGVEVLDEVPLARGDMLVARFADPFGNVHEVTQRTGLTRAQALAAFERFKSLRGSWQGKSTKGWSELSEYRVIAKGSVVMHSSFDAHPAETMVSMIHLDQDRLLLTHYCVAQNQPRLVASKVSDDGRTIEFTYLDATNLASRDRGHMDSVRFRFQDADRFTSQWTWYQDGHERWMEEIEMTRASPPK